MPAIRAFGGLSLKGCSMAPRAVTRVRLDEAREAVRVRAEVGGATVHHEPVRIRSNFTNGLKHLPVRIS